SPRTCSSAPAMRSSVRSSSTSSRRGSPHELPHVSGARYVRGEPVLGLEIHVHLKTRTKMFCRCELEYGGAENTHTCPVCLAHPGTLPVPKRRAIKMTIYTAHASAC